MAQRSTWVIAFGFAFAVVGCGSSGNGSASGSGGSGATGGTGGVGTDPCPQGDVGAWRQMATPNLTPPSNLLGMWPVKSFWSGKYMLLFTYDGSATTNFTYDPCADTWQPLPTGAPNPLYDALSGMLGSRLAIFKPPTSADAGAGAWLDAEATKWTSMNMLGAPAAGVETEFAKDSILSFGGDPSLPTPITDYATGTRYDLASDAWRAISVPTGFAPRGEQAHVLVGDQLVVWGGGPKTGAALGDGAVYSLATDSWKSVSSVGAPSARTHAVVVSTGGAVAIWGGYGSYQDFFNQSNPKTDGGIYTPSSDTWKPITQVGAPDLHAVMHAVWTGKKLLLLGEAFTDGDVVVSGGLYDPASDSWTTVQTAGAPTLEELTSIGARAFVSAGGIVVLQHMVGNVLGVHLFDSNANAWSTATTTGAPMRQPLTTVWTGARLIDWGGAEGTQTGCPPNSPPGCDPYMTYTSYVDGGIYRVE